MKNKFLSLLLAVSLLAMTITGCGDKEPVKESKQTESVQTSTESQEISTTDFTDPQPGQSVTGEGITVEGPGEDDGSIIEVEGEVTEIVEGDVVEIIEGEVTESTETKDDDATDDTSDDGTDWSTAYDDYFTRDNIMPATPKISGTAVGGGMSFEMVVAMDEENAFMSYDFGAVAMDMYVMPDKAYVRTEMEGQEAWIFAPITSKEEAQEMTVGIEDNTTLVDSEHIGTVTYREALEEDGVIYDVLDVTVEDGSGVPGNAVYFINRETQLIAKCVMERQGETAVCLVEEIESIELPAEAADATEGTIEDVLGTMVGVLFMGAGMAAE